MAPTIYQYQEILYLRLSELPAQAQAALRPWLEGQTSAYIPGLGPEDVVYLLDYERWQRELVDGEGGDWD